MATATETAQLTIALVGNPNTGKSTLFNALSGMNQRVGNFPGVTVEKKIGHFKQGDHAITLIDLPGTYSLSPQSPDEMVAFDVLIGRQRDVAAPQVIVCVVDANNLERNLYLCSQLLELNLPLVIALNMTDIAERNQVKIDIDRLAENLGVAVVPVQANRRVGLDRLKQAIVEAKDQPSLRHTAFSNDFVEAVEGVKKQLVEKTEISHADFLARRMVLDTNDLISGAYADDELREAVLAARDKIRSEHSSLAALESISRYQWIDRLLSGVVSRSPRTARSWGDRLDDVLTHRFWGSAIFVVLMVVVFQAIFSWAAPVMEGVDASVGWLTDVLTASLPDGMFKSLLADGVLAGVGSVLVFLPQIFILFFFIALLEDCGYMARAAYLMDKLMSRVGLSGKSFIPLLSSFACAIPGIMATRVIENRRDRMITMLVAPLMSCSARLPVYVLLIAAFIPSAQVLGTPLNVQGLTMLAMYMIGIVVAIGVAYVLRKTILRGATPPFVMELPEYKWPSISNVLRRMFEQGWAFVRRAGTVIFSVAIIIWALVYFPRDPQVEQQVRDAYAPQMAEIQQEIEAGEASPKAHEALQREVDNRVSSAYLQNSILGSMGQWIEPVVRPLGWDWKIAAATIASFPAREVVIGTLGVIYSVGDDADESSRSLRERLRTATWDGTNKKVYNIPVALSIMVFFALCAQCVSTLAIMRRETASWRWPIFTFVYMTVLAYLGALVTYQIGIRLIG